MSEFEENADDLSDAAGEKRAGVIQSVSIAARFLTILAASDGELPLGELARRAGTGRSTAHRYMQSLVRERLVAQDQVTGGYDLGPAALNIGISALKRIDPVAVAARHMKSMAARNAASCGVAIWTDRGPTIVQWYRSARFAISTVTLGDVLPLDNTACGLVFQAYLQPEQIEAVRRLQPDAFRGKRPASGVLEDIRRAGGAQLNERLFSALTGKAAPVFNVYNEICCVVTTVSFVETAEIEGHGAALFEAARQATQDSGGS